MPNSVLNELSAEEHKRIVGLFEKLDIDKDGRINISDVTTALNQLQTFKKSIPEQVEVLFNSCDKNKDGHIEFGDFIKYIVDHENRLRISFKALDHNNDGVLDLEEVIIAFHKLGVDISRAEARKMLKKMDKDETFLISWTEWRDFLLLHPAKDIFDLVHFWRHATIMDIGEGAIVPDDFTKNEIESGMWWRNLLAGGAAGTVSRTCTAPLDRLKVLLQVSGGIARHPLIAGSTSNINGKLGIYSGMDYMLKEGGLKSLWRGNGINVVKIAPESALKFMAYEQVKRLLKSDDTRELKVFERFLAGSTAGAISQSAIYPMEVIKTRLALRKTGQFKGGIAECIKHVYINGGILAFYRGYIPNLIGIIPYAGIDLAIYETLKRFYMRKRKNEDPGILTILCCGMFSSTCGQLASYPLALVRTKLQSFDNDPKKNKIKTIFQNIIRQDGIKGLYTGITPNLMKVLPAVGISYVVYEHFRNLLGVKMT